MSEINSSMPMNIPVTPWQNEADKASFCAFNFPPTKIRPMHVKNALRYEGRFTRSDLYAISLQILGVGHATIPHIKAMDVPFHMGYSGPVCSKRLLSDRPKCKRLLADPGEYPNMIIKYLSVGQWS